MICQKEIDIILRTTDCDTSKMIGMPTNKPSARSTAPGLYICTDNVVIRLYDSPHVSKQYASRRHPKYVFCQKNGLILNAAHDVIITISSTVMNRVMDCVHQGSDETKTLTIPNTVNTVKESAFSTIARLRIVRLNDSLKVLEEKCFEQSGLIKVMIPQSVQEIKSCAFRKCACLKNVSCEEKNSDIGIVSAIRGDEGMRTFSHPKLLQQIS